MPTYEYRCDRGHTFDVIQRMSDDPVATCEVCGRPVQRVLQPVAVHFKGSGFYNTDYGTRKRQRENAASSDGVGAASKSSDSTGGDSKGSDSKGGDGAKSDKSSTPAPAPKSDGAGSTSGSTSTSGGSSGSGGGSKEGSGSTGSSKRRASSRSSG